MNMHRSFHGVAALGFPDGRNEGIAQGGQAHDDPTPFPSPLKGAVLPPDHHLMCLDVAYFLAGSAPYEWEKDYSPAWRFVGKHLRWSERVMRVVDASLRNLWSVPAGQNVPKVCRGFLRKISRGWLLISKISVCWAVYRHPHSTRGLCERLQRLTKGDLLRSTLHHRSTCRARPTSAPRGSSLLVRSSRDIRPCPPHVRREGPRVLGRGPATRLVVFRLGQGRLGGEGGGRRRRNVRTVRAFTDPSEMVADNHRCCGSVAVHRVRGDAGFDDEPRRAEAGDRLAWWSGGDGES